MDESDKSGSTCESRKNCSFSLWRSREAFGVAKPCLAKAAKSSSFPTTIKCSRVKISQIEADLCWPVEVVLRRLCVAVLILDTRCQMAQAVQADRVACHDRSDASIDDDDGIYRRLEAKFDLCVLKAL